MNTADYLIKLERDMVGGMLHALILVTVQRDGPIHGYGLIRSMDEATGDKGLWKEGTIYPLLGTMEKEGLLKSRWGKGSTGPRRKYYELTAAGRQVLRVARTIWSDTRETLDRLLEAP